MPYYILTTKSLYTHRNATTINAVQRKSQIAPPKQCDVEGNASILGDRLRNQTSVKEYILWNRYTTLKINSTQEGVRYKPDLIKPVSHIYLYQLR